MDFNNDTFEYNLEDDKCPQCGLKNGVHKMSCSQRYMDNYIDNDDYIPKEKMKKKSKKFNKDKDEFN